MTACDEGGDGHRCGGQAREHDDGPSAVRALPRRPPGDLSIEERSGVDSAVPGDVAGRGMLLGGTTRPYPRTDAVRSMATRPAALAGQLTGLVTEPAG